MAAETQRGKETVFIAAGVALAVYFACPFTYAIPIMMVCRVAGTNPNAAEVFFRPIDWLGQHCPPYRLLLEAEGAAVRKTGVLELLRK
jgi:hypothetical protein